MQKRKIEILRELQQKIDALEPLCEWGKAYVTTNKTHKAHFFRKQRARLFEIMADKLGTKL